MQIIKKVLPATLMLVALIIFASCEKKDDNPEPTPAPTTGDVKVEFNYVFGSSGVPWDILYTLRHPKTGDTLTFTEFSFYVSNVRLKNEDGIWWSEPESYHLVCATCINKNYFTISEVPEGNYTEMDFLFGVDSARNVSGAQNGDLSPAFGMYWDSSRGYIMLKAEGLSAQSSDGTFSFHLGGFSGDDNLVTPRSFTFGGNIASVGQTTPTIVYRANPARLWHSSPGVSSRSSIDTPGPEAKAMATDFYSNVAFLEIK